MGLKKDFKHKKTYLQNIYLEYEKNVLAASKVSSSAVRERKIGFLWLKFFFSHLILKRERDKFEMMKKVANGFSRTLPQYYQETLFALK